MRAGGHEPEGVRRPATLGTRPSSRISLAWLGHPVPGSTATAALRARAAPGASGNGCLAQNAASSSPTTTPQMPCPGTVCPAILGLIRGLKNHFARAVRRRLACVSLTLTEEAIMYRDHDAQASL
jgi:hypothetical protein